MTDRRQRRRRLATIACALWIVGFEVLPDIHVGLHDRLAPHAHGHDVETAGPIVRVTYDSTHRHDDGTWHSHVGEARDSLEPSSLIPGAAALSVPVGAGHGAHSLAHREIATLAPPPVITEPLPATRDLTWAERSIDIAPHSAIAPLAVARGPPAA